MFLHKGKILMNITDFLKIQHGHMHISFVDINTDSDLKLFLDPTLIKLGGDECSKRAARLIDDFEKQLYNDMRTGKWNNTPILDAAHEVHDTKLGYGNGQNGKGKTAEGMRESLKGLCGLAQSIPSIALIQDVSVFVEDFAEDRMSDLLTNVLRRELCSFTKDKMEFYGKRASGKQKIESWDIRTHSWCSTEEPYWLVNGQKILLVPKRWVRSNFLFSTNQYLCRVVIEQMQRELEYENLSKKDILKNMERTSRNWKYDRVRQYTCEKPDALAEYHHCLPGFYAQKGYMSDSELDKVAYGYCVDGKEE